MKAEQLPLELEHRPARGREDFLVAPANEHAVALIDRWPDWPDAVLALAGAPGTGKTHLAEVWRTRSGARRIEAAKLTKKVVPELAEAGAVIVEDGEALQGEGLPALFHLINLVRETKGFLLLTGKEPPARWPVSLPDLSSRLKAVPCAEIGAPDDALLSALMIKLFDDRQLAVPAPVISYLVPRMERSFAALSALVEALDRASLAGKRPITVPLAAEILKNREESAL